MGLLSFAHVPNKVAGDEWRITIMSLEPTTTAKVQVNTTKGAIVLALWAKELPNTCRQFLQNCLDGKYDGKEFNKIIKDYLVQLDAGELDYGLQDEFNSRIRFGQKGLLAAIKKDESVKNNHSVDSWFITLTPTPEYNNRYNVFGKLVGESIYNVLKINDSELKDNLPVFPAKIINIDILEQYFDLQKSPVEPVKKKVKLNKHKVKVAYEENDDDNDNDIDVSFKMKSAHELLKDKKLINQKVTEEQVNKSREVAGVDGDSGVDVDRETTDVHEDTNAIEKLQPKEQVVEDAIEEQLKHPHKDTEMKPIKRDPTIDSDYDSNLDLSDSEFDKTKFHAHKFTVTTR